MEKDQKNRPEALLEAIKRGFGSFTGFELALWIGSLLFIILSFILFGGKGLLTLVASLIGVTALIFSAKGNPIGQALMIIFCILYGIISFGFRYYGEMITYLGMSLPMAVIGLVSWLKNPFKGELSQVAVGRVGLGEALPAAALSIGVTWVFYFILKAFSTANLLFSTLSVTTTFIAAYLNFRRSPFFALAYAVNDVVLIVLWVLASRVQPDYASVVICFMVFLVNDLYGFFNWLKMRRHQASVIDS